MLITERLLALRKSKGLTQNDVSRRIDVSRPAYSRYESGEREPDLNTVKKLAGLFGTSSDYLIGLSDSSEPLENAEPAIRLLQRNAKVMSSAQRGKMLNILKASFEDFNWDEEK